MLNLHYPKLNFKANQVSGDSKPRPGKGKEGQPGRGTGSERSQRKAICVTTTYQKATVSAIPRYFRKFALKEPAASGCPDRNSALGRRRRKESAARARANSAPAARTCWARSSSALPFRAAGPSLAPRERPRGGAKIDPTNSYKLERERRQSG